MNYWQFKFKEENWSFWTKVTVGHIEDWRYPRLKNHKNIAIGDIVFIYRSDKNRGIYFVAKIVNIDFDRDEKNPLDLVIIADHKDYIFKPEENGFDDLVRKINKLGQNGAVYKFLKNDSPEKLYDMLMIKKSKNGSILDLDTFERNFELEISKSKKENYKTRQVRLKNNKNIKPKKVKVTTTVYNRNPDVVVAVLERANGICEHCNEKAPFLRAKDKSPYLEVHHKIRLADDGVDTIQNAIAVCPNCHRKLHFG